MGQRGGAEAGDRSRSRRSLLGNRRWPRGSLMASLAAADREALLDLGILGQHESGSTLITEGERSKHLYLLVDGCVKATAVNADGHVALLAIRVAGDLVGELSSLDSHPRSATVTAAGQLVTCRISQAEFHDFLLNHPTAALVVGGSVSYKLRSATQRWVDFGGRDARIRLVRVLAELARAYGRSVAEGVEIGISLTQPELAGLIGAGEPTVHKVLADLRRDGFVDTGYRKMIIRDLGALEKIAGLAP
jgi:CRP/FNR family cyclic AMP-dependent transcriptional regulator